MLDNNENQILEEKGSLTPEAQSAVVASFPLDGKELGLNVSRADVTWSKEEEAALVRRLGMFELHLPFAHKVMPYCILDLRIMPLVTFLYLCNFIECVSCSFVALLPSRI
jgi:hypothetical protein